MTFISKTQHADVVLIGGGIMSATLGAFLKQLEPNWTISLFERLDRPGLESSDPWNNAGTGHAALCELNYSPAAKDGSVDPSKALHINEQFQLSRQFWSHLVTNSLIGSPKGFINTVPHMSFVVGEENTKFLRTRYEALKPNPLFRSMEYSEDQAQIAKWAPLIIKGRDPKQRVAATRAAEGTDVDFGALTRELTGYLGNNGVEINYGHDVTGISRAADGGWDLSLKHPRSGERGSIHAKFVFVGAGGGALHLLQASGIPESKGYGGFPVSGQFFRCTDESLAAQHSAKVYGQASVGAPPMSVPHLDTRYVNGKRSLLFGPYAGFSTNFLKNGSYLDLPLSIRPSNIIPMLAVAKDNMDLTAYPGQGSRQAPRRQGRGPARVLPRGQGRRLGAHHRRPARADHQEGPEEGRRAAVRHRGHRGPRRQHRRPAGCLPGCFHRRADHDRTAAEGLPEGLQGLAGQAQGDDAGLRRQAQREPGTRRAARGRHGQGPAAGNGPGLPLKLCRVAARLVP